LGESKKAALHIIKKGIPALIKISTAGVVDTSEIIKEQISTLTSELSNDAINTYLHDKEQILIFKESLSKIFCNSEDKLYVFIDELDRCRPNYAIELLERLKHLLDINGLVFILAMDKTQLGHSVRAIYGQDFESVGYLRRFIDLEYNIPKRNLDDFIDGLYQDFGFNIFFEKRKKISSISI
jgi:predicted KAP-like P-loop ATPase